MTLRQLARNDEVEIETRRDSKSPKHQTIIWIVATDRGIHIRSFRGKRGRWYQEALANPALVIHTGGRKVSAWAEPERDPTVIEEVNRAYREKYGKRWPAETRSMLTPSVLPTTLRLIPRKEPAGTRR